MKRTCIAMVLLIMIFAILPEVANSQPHSRCPDKIFDAGTFEGTYLGTDCGDLCYSAFRLENGEEFEIICADDDAERFFGSGTGQKVSVTYELRQFWDVSAEYCTRMEVCISGQQLPSNQGSHTGQAPSSKIAKLFTPSMLGKTIAILEHNFGPASEEWDGRDETIREYEIDGCQVQIIGNKSISAMQLTLSPLCSFDLAPFIQNDKALPAHSLTFGAFEEATGDMGRYGADCLYNCGNAYDPSMYLLYHGPRALGFLDIRLGAELKNTSAWVDRMIAEQGEEWVMEQRFNEERRYDDVARAALKNVTIETIRLGHNLSFE